MNVVANGNIVIDSKKERASQATDTFVDSDFAILIEIVGDSTGVSQRKHTVFLASALAHKS